MKIQIECTSSEAKRLIDSLDTLIRLASCLARYREQLRSRIKYASDSDPKEFTQGVEFAQQAFFDRLEADGIDLEDLEQLSQQAFDMLTPQD